jgi:hypothetical protein
MNGEKSLREACLEYSAAFHRWQGEYELQSGTLLVHMESATFQEYLTAQGHGEPMPDQRQAVIEMYSHLSAWIELARVVRDPRVSMRVLGGTHPGEYRVDLHDPGHPHPLPGDSLHWNAPLQRWVAQNERGILWVPKASFLREDNRVLRGYLDNPDGDKATPAQCLAATATVSHPGYWDTVEDPDVERFPAGEVPYVSESK